MRQRSFVRNISEAPLCPEGKSAVGSRGYSVWGAAALLVRESSKVVDAEMGLEAHHRSTKNVSTPGRRQRTRHRGVGKKPLEGEELATPRDKQHHSTFTHFRRRDETRKLPAAPGLRA
jgi:hypothetical protein